MTTIIIEVSGGVVQNVFSDDDKAKVVIVDWDNLDDLSQTDKDTITDKLEAVCDRYYTNLSFGHGTTLEQVESL